MSSDYLLSVSNEQLQLDMYDLQMDLATIAEYVRVAPEVDQYLDRQFELEQQLSGVLAELKCRGAL